MDYPGWENSFTYANKRFERYIEQKRDGKAGSASETVKVAIAVFNFLKKKFIEQTFPSVPEELLASALIEEIEHYIIKDVRQRTGNIWLGSGDWYRRSCLPLPQTAWI